MKRNHTRKRESAVEKARRTIPVHSAAITALKAQIKELKALIVLRTEMRADQQAIIDREQEA